MKISPNLGICSNPFLNMPLLFRHPKGKDTKDKERGVCKPNSKEESFFLMNGGRMLEKLITTFNGNCNLIRMFTKKELDKATHNYHIDGILRRDWNFVLYKGIHEDREILVKKFGRSSPQCEDDPVDFISNEVAIVSQMNKHKNVLKLLGYCLEIEFPTLVYEFAGNGNLSEYIYLDGQVVLPWEIKLRIATQVANALAYLHEGTSRVIIHRDIMPRYIFLDQDYVPKLSEFQISVPIPLGKTHVDVRMGGTIGYLAPEVISGRITEKSDVYNFGIVLIEILTGKKIKELLNSIDDNVIGSPEKSASSSGDCYFNEPNELENNDLSEYEMQYKEACLKALILEDGNRGQVMQCAVLAVWCVKMNPEERPTMKEVAKSLRSLQSIQY